jgi:uncharacterized protein YdeI (YjbR/CyaY-like superfamily)
VGYYKKGTGRPSITWPESVEQALCFGWIDGLRKGIDEQRFTIRFTPRKPGSVWSAINTRKVNELIKAGTMQPAGLAAFKHRKPQRSGIYSFEQRSAELDEKFARAFRRRREAWKFYQAQPPGYRKAVNWWVTSAKQESTRTARLAKLMEHSARGERVPQFTAWNKRKAK